MYIYGILNLEMLESIFHTYLHIIQEDNGNTQDS
jgi:hypothetical protein